MKREGYDFEYSKFAFLIEEEIKVTWKAQSLDVVALRVELVT